jgi:hypothetical protein
MHGRIGATSRIPRPGRPNLHHHSLAEMIDRHMTAGYDEFDFVCRTAYNVVARWTAPIIPWDEIVSEYGQSFRPSSDGSARDRP